MSNGVYLLQQTGSSDTHTISLRNVMKLGHLSDKQEAIQLQQIACIVPHKPYTAKN